MVILIAKIIYTWEGMEGLAEKKDKMTHKIVQ
jgi:hypothetical protein